MSDFWVLGFAKSAQPNLRAARGIGAAVKEQAVITGAVAYAGATLVVGAITTPIRMYKDAWEFGTAVNERLSGKDRAWDVLFTGTNLMGDIAGTYGLGKGIDYSVNSKVIKGDFPANSSTKYLVRKPHENGSGYGFAEYNTKTTQAKYRVDFSGAHGNISGSHMQIAKWNTTPNNIWWNGWGRKSGVDVFPYRGLSAVNARFWFGWK